MVHNLNPIHEPKYLTINWTFTQDDYQKMQQGYTSQDMDDKWHASLKDDVLSLHRSWTGNEIFRIKLVKVGNLYSAQTIEVEQNPERYKATNEAETFRTLELALNVALNIVPLKH